ncbi:MAG: rod shape-determining protein RodA [Actinomycetota bacterium]
MASTGSLGRVHRIGRRRVQPPSITRRVPWRSFDLPLVLVTFALTAFGNLIVYSASAPELERGGTDPGFFLDRQLAASLLGFFAMVVVALIGYQRLRPLIPIAYGAALLLLVVVLSPLGANIKGAQRWVDLGSFQLQPSELMKLGAIAALALLLANARGYPRGPDVMRAIAVIAVPVGLIYLQPDLGTLLVLIAVLFAMLLVAGTPARILVGLSLAGVILVAGVFTLDLLADYQKARITAFLDDTADPLGANYNLTQARIAVGSGRIAGRGLFSGTQTNLDFVPEVHTDFIFTAVGEQLGFIGAASLLALFGVYLYRGIRIALGARDLFGTLLAAGVVAMTAFQIFVNIGMTVGLSPITGIPLPFVSYGGTAILTAYLATGVLLSVQRRPTEAFGGRTTWKR